MAFVLTETYSYENFRTVKFEKTFTGAAFKGLNGSPIAFNYSDVIDEGEFIYEVFYRVTTPLTSGDLAGTYLLMGIQTDDTDCILNSTTGILNTLNTNSAGFKPSHAYTKSTADGRTLLGNVGGIDHITGGTIEIILTIARCNVIATGTVTEV